MQKVRLWPAVCGAVLASCGGTVVSDRSHTTDHPAGTDAGAQTSDGGTEASSGPDSRVVVGCPTETSGPTDPGRGQCLPPDPPAALGSPCACWALEGAPGADQCPPSPAGELGAPCCLGEACSFDFGSGCAKSPLALQGTAPVPACGGPRTAPELLAEGPIRDVRMSQTSVYVREIDASGTAAIGRVGKGDCAATPLATDGSVSAMEATDSALFVVTPQAGGGDTLTMIPEGSTTGSPVPLDSLLTPPLHVEGLGTDGSSLYAVIAHPPDPNDPNTYESAAVEVPCCGGAPRVFATTDLVLLHAFSTPVVRDGSSLFWLATPKELLRDPSTFLTRFDLTAGSATRILDGVPRQYDAFAVVDGIVYLGGDRAVSAFRVPGCFTSPLIDDRHAQITAFALSEGTAYWAESGRGLAYSTLYARPKSGGTARKLADTPGNVTWIAVDATDVYWLLTPASPAVAQVLRIARP